MEVTLMKPVQNERETQNRQNTTTTSESYNDWNRQMLRMPT